MKRTLMIIAGLIAGVAFATNSYAQQASLVQDQNPRYEIAQAKYMSMSDSLTRDQGTTIQNTYKAYDWYEAREERRKLRRERNYESSLYSYPYYGNSYFYPSLNFGWGHRHNNHWGYYGSGFGW